MKQWRIVPLVFATLAAVSCARDVAAAQDWPARSVMVVSPFAAGSANDTVARVVLDQVGQQTGQPFIVENRPGGGGVVGVASVVRAEPDGYTLPLSSASMSSVVILHNSLPYDELRDLEPVAMLSTQPSVLVAAPGAGFRSVADLVAAAKAQPGELNFASAGIGSASHIAGERFRLAAELNVQHIPYRGPVEALADLMTGRIDFYFLPIAPALSLIKQSKVVALAVSTPRRCNCWAMSRRSRKQAIRTPNICSGAACRRRLKRRAKLNDEVNKALGMPAIKEKLQNLGVQPEPMTPDQFAKFFAGDVAAMVKLGKDANITPMD